MKRNKKMAFSLLFCSIAMIAGMILNKAAYWFSVDVLVIIVCAVNGIILLKNKQ